ncbi:hypothetical protein MTR67_000021 [Solanum verrucosum]|uniref:Uncharacterized protein n=1 Tax=Solanum verrucosum TaxID=315347 RepID=A0AAF0T655_SOLVR|nr:hypothetical protein MTR67_000021 [Solanum verrucosum]
MLRRVLFVGCILLERSGRRDPSGILEEHRLGVVESGGDEGEEGCGYFREPDRIHAGAHYYINHSSRKEGGSRTFIRVGEASGLDILEFIYIPVTNLRAHEKCLPVLRYAGGNLDKW